MQFPQYPFTSVLIVVVTSAIFLTPGILKFFRYLCPFFKEHLPLGVSFGIFALVLASILEFPIIFVKVPFLIALTAAVVEEPLKVFIPKFFLKNEQWLYGVLLSGFFFGVFEGLYAMVIVIILGLSPLLALLRVFLVFLHSLWTGISAITLRKGSPSGLFVSMFLHFLYNYSMLSSIHDVFAVVGAVISISLTGLISIIEIPDGGKNLSHKNNTE